MSKIKVTLEDEDSIFAVIQTKAIVDALKGIRTTLAWIAFWAFIIAFEVCGVWR